MTDSASQSLVERLKQQALNRAEKFGAGSYLATVEWQAAARITELEADLEREKGKADTYARWWREQRSRAIAALPIKSNAELLSLERALAAESELSRVEGETRSRVIKLMFDVATHVGIAGVQGSDRTATSYRNDLADRIRSLPPLAKRGEQKSRERSNPPAEQSTTLPQQLTEN